MIRVLDPWELLVTFMGSANNNIKRCMAMVQALAAAFPANRICGTTEVVAADSSKGAGAGEVDGVEEVEHYCFPTVDQVMTLSEAAIWELGWGYRAPRLYRLCREVHANGGAGWLAALGQEDEATARAALMKLSGVGRKVADCCLLFGYGHDGCVPVDTHCLQLARRLMLASSGTRGEVAAPAAPAAPLSARLYDEIVSCFHANFGASRAGHAFMQMFVAELADFRRLMAGAEGAAEACQTGGDVAWKRIRKRQRLSDSKVGDQGNANRVSESGGERNAEAGGEMIGREATPSAARESIHRKRKVSSKTITEAKVVPATARRATRRSDRSPPECDDLSARRELHVQQPVRLRVLANVRTVRSIRRAADAPARRRTRSSGRTPEHTER